jgi:hypothetical protein
MLNGLNLIGAGFLAALSPEEGSQAQAEPPVDTSARLTVERMEELVAVPRRLIEEGDVAGAKLAFARQLEETVRLNGAESLAAGDLLVSFGMILFERGGRAERRAAIGYLERGARTYEAALGRSHPEVGLTWSDVGNALLAMSPDDPPPEAEAALERAWLARRDSLGRSNVETASTLATLARLRGLPSRTRGERSRIDAAAALFAEAIADFGTRFVEPGGFGSITTRFALARMYLVNELPREALAAALAAYEDYRANFSGHEPMCAVLNTQSSMLVIALQRRGHRAEADALRTALAGLPCYDQGAVVIPTPGVR